MKHSKIKKLDEIVLFAHPVRDSKGERFLPYCDLGWHQGIVKDYSLCEQRGCKHYIKLYILHNR